MKNRPMDGPGLPLTGFPFCISHFSLPGEVGHHTRPAGIHPARPEPPPVPVHRRDALGGVSARGPLRAAGALPVLPVSRILRRLPRDAAPLRLVALDGQAPREGVRGLSSAEPPLGVPAPPHGDRRKRRYGGLCLRNLPGPNSPQRRGAADGAEKLRPLPCGDGVANRCRTGVLGLPSPLHTRGRSPARRTVST